MTSRPRIRWSTILLYGFVAEILVFVAANFVVDPLFQKVAGPQSDDLVTTVDLGVPSFLLLLVFGYLAARKVQTRKVLHGFFVGFAAFVYIFVFMLISWRAGTLPLALFSYPYNIANILKLLGGACGGLLADSARRA